MDYLQHNPIPLVDNKTHTSLQSTIKTIFDWEYSLKQKNLMRLYEKGKRLNWNASDLPWDTDVQPGNQGRLLGPQARRLLNIPDAITDEMFNKISLERNAFMLSQFLHGEQGALLVTAKLVQSCPDEESKFYASSQVTDEARHVEVYHRYLTEKLNTGGYPIIPSLKLLLDDIITASDWDISFLGMQIMVEGVALGSFSFVKMVNPDEPLITEITERIMQDESRHVAFGVNALSNIYKPGELSAQELREREDFVIEASHILRERLGGDQIFDKLGINMTPEIIEWDRNSVFLKGITHMTFSKVVPNLKRIGLLTPRVRKAYEQMDLLKFENNKDSLEDETIQPPEELVKGLMEHLSFPNVSP